MKKIDGLFLAETWHDSDSVCISLLKQKGMKVYDQARQMKPYKINKLSTSHGGVPAIVNAGFELLPMHIDKQSIHFEHICVRISSKSRSVIFLVVYRTGYAPSGFYDDFTKSTNTLSTYNEEVIILGNFNFHLEQADYTFTQNFSNLLTLHNFHSSIDQPTHYFGGWLTLLPVNRNSK